MNELLDRLLEVVDSGFAPAPGLLKPNHDLVHDYYNKLLNIIRAAQQGVQADICHVCDGEKGGRDKWGGWHDCPECNATGTRR